MEVRNKLFHGINLSNYYEEIGDLTDIDILKSILESNYIYSRNDLYEKKEEISRFLNLSYLQKEDEVCLALHPNNDIFNICQSSSLEDAFVDFIENNISLILDEALLEDREYQISGMPREIRVRESICLYPYLIAIGYYDRYYQGIKKLEKIVKKPIINYGDISKYCEVRDIVCLNNFEDKLLKSKRKYFIIKELLKAYGLCISIVDPYTGIPISEDLDKEISQAKVLRNLARDKCRI